MLRELTFHEGDTIGGNDLNKRISHSRQNLLNTSLFNFVTIAPACIPDSAAPGYVFADVTINVKERWYTWPVPVFSIVEQNVNTWWRNGHNLQRANYGIFLTRYNFRGREETIAAICQFGYAEEFGAQYSIPYLNKKQTLGVTLTGTYTKNHEVAYETYNDKLVYYKDVFHYLRSQTLGSVVFSYRQGFYIHHTLEFRYTDLFIKDTVRNLSENYFPDASTRMRYFTLSYHVVRDYRDSKAYPLKGHFEEIEITKHGLGIMPGENLDVFYVASSLRWYQPIASRFYFAAMAKGRWVPGPVPPYYHQRALGFGPYVRGYEYYIIDGENYALGKISFRYALMKPHTYQLKSVNAEKFTLFHIALYTGIYADAAYVQDRSSTAANNPLGNTMLFGYGAGLDFVTYYDITARFEYSFNKMGENGFFVHLEAAF